MMIIAAFFLIFFWPFLVLRPILKQVREHPTPRTRSRFSTTDLLALMFLIQLPFALLNVLEARIRDAHPAAFVLMLFISFMFWIAGLRAVNHLGIESQLKRLLTIGLIFPVAIAGGMPLAVFFVRVVDGDNFAANVLGLAITAILSWLVYQAARWVSSPVVQNE